MATNTPALSTSAGHRVAHVFELLEKILLSIDTSKKDELKTLLLSQRVCKAFRDTIANSAPLQSALFFAPSSDDALPANNPYLLGEVLLQLPNNVSISLHFWRMYGSTGCGPGDYAIQLYKMRHTNSENAAVAAEPTWRKMMLRRKPYRVNMVRALGLGAKGTTFGGGKKGP